MNRRKTSVPTDRLARPPTEARGADILLVGLNNEEARTLPSRLFGALANGTVEVALDALNRDRLKGVMAILSPIIGKGFDAIDLAEILEDSGFTGRYIAYAAEVAHEPLIRAEVSKMAPSLTFDIVTMGYGPRLAPN